MDMKTLICVAALAVVVSCSDKSKYYPVKFNNLGCWNDTADRAITTREGDPILGEPAFSTRVNAITKCARVAHKHENDVFAIQAGGWCASSDTARDTYKKYGKSTACEKDGRGGYWANQVYEIVSIARVSLINLGCWEDIDFGAITTLEDKDPILENVHYQFRQEAIAKCVQAAYARGYDVIALQNGGWCSGSRDAVVRYKKYGRKSNCAADGKGGPGANQVYRINVEVTTIYG